MNDGKRGAYRALHTVLVDDPDFQDLSPDAKLLFYTGRLQLGPTGIGVLYESALSDQTGIPSEGVRDGLLELVEGGWIEWQRNVVWFVNGLRFEPSISLGNDNHRTSVLNHLQGLPKLDIVNKFAAHYDLEEPFDSPSDSHWHTPTPSHGDTPSDGIGDHGRTEERKTEGSAEGSSLRSSPSEPDGSLDDDPGEEEPWNDRIAESLREHAYPDGEPEGSWTIGQDLSIARQLIEAGYSVEHLEDAIEAVRMMVEAKHSAVRDWIDPDGQFTLRVLNRKDERGQKLVQVAPNYLYKHGPTGQTAEAVAR